MIFFLQKRYPEAEALYRRTLGIWETAMGSDNPDLATTLDNLAVVLASQEKFEEAEPLYRRSLALRERVTLASLNNLAMVLEGNNHDIAAERQWKLAVTVGDKLPILAGDPPGKDSELLAKTLQNYAALLRKMKREAEAKKMEARAKALLNPDQQ
jgi:tetratricopeptide (TPR) repeat protein